MTTSIVRYYKGAERPDLTLVWRAANGVLLDLSVNSSFELKIGVPGVAAAFTKTTGITGAQTAPNVTIAFTAGELDALPVARYIAQLRARDTVSNQDRYMRFWFYFLNSVQ